MNICSLLPGATEVVAALGLADHLVGISHECDYPKEICDKPVVVHSTVSTDHKSSKQIHEQVTDTLLSGHSLYSLDRKHIAQVKPDVIITQGLCHVCALTPAQVQEAVEHLAQPPQLLTLNPTNLDGVLSDITRIGAATQRDLQATTLLNDLKRRLDHVAQKVSQTEHRPRVACIEWFDPLYIAGHWVPEMVALAGGIDILGTQGNPSTVITIDDLERAAPDIMVFMPCGFSIERCREEFHHVQQRWNSRRISALHDGRVFLVNASAYFSRPGPRLIDGVEILASILHPDLFDPLSSSQAQPLVAPAERPLHEKP